MDVHCCFKSRTYQPKKQCCFSSNRIVCLLLAFLSATFETHEETKDSPSLQYHHMLLKIFIYVNVYIYFYIYIYNYKFKCGYICKLLQARRNVVGYGLCCSGAPYCETKDLFVCQHGIFFARLRGPKAVTSHNQLLYARRQKVLLIARTRIL